MAIKKGFLFLAVIVFMFSMNTIFAQITLENAVEDVYNLGDTLELSINILEGEGFVGPVSILLSCEEDSVEVYKEYLLVKGSVEKEVVIPLIGDFIGDLKGKCIIKARVNENVESISSGFKVSNLILVDLENQTNIYSPEERVLIKGFAKKENGAFFEGDIELKLDSKKVDLDVFDLSSGSFEIGFDLSKYFEAGEHLIEIGFIEKGNDGKVSNEGIKRFFIYVEQVATNLEVVLDNREVMPGEDLEGSVRLYDQTGEIMAVPVDIEIVNNEGEFVEKISSQKGDFKYELEKMSSPGNWEILAKSQSLSFSEIFKVLINSEVSVGIVNNTVIVENIGNVPYNGTIPVTIGLDEKLIDVNLDLREIKKYSLHAPDGEYLVEVADVSKNLFLTGNAVRVKEIVKNNPRKTKIVAWAFVAILLGFSAFIFFKKSENKTFMGRRSGKQKKEPLELKSIPEPKGLADSKIKAELSLSITGTKQNSPIGCISIKNYHQTKEGKGGVKETLDKISFLVEKRKGIIYENKENIFYMLPPVKTKTFKNEISMLELSLEIKKQLDLHNKKFKQKIDYGLALNFGTIVTRQGKDSFNFMSMGTVMTVVKKLANKSSGEIFMNDKFRSKVEREVKAKRIDILDFNVYEFEGFVKSNRDNSEFIKNFVAKQKSEGAF